MEPVQSVFKTLRDGILSYMGYSSSTSFQNPSFEGKDVECPICLQIPEEEIYQCKNGHMICASCSSEVESCPQCRCDLKVDGALIRNRLAESLVAKVGVSCPAIENGCAFRGNRKQIELHKKECKYMRNAVTLCKLIGYKCDYLTRSSEKRKVIDHFVEYHDAQVIRLDDDFVGVTYGDFSDLGKDRIWKAYWPLVVTISDNTSFLMYLDKVDEFMTLSCIMLDNSTKSYESEFIIPSPHTKTRQVILTGPVKTFDDIKSDHGETGLRYSDLQKLYTLDDKFQAQISINRVYNPKRVVAFKK